MTCHSLTSLAVAVGKALGSGITSQSAQFPVVSFKLFLRRCRFKTLGLNCAGALKHLTPCLEILNLINLLFLFSVTFDLWGQPFVLPLTMELRAQLAESSS